MSVSSKRALLPLLAAACCGLGGCAGAGLPDSWTTPTVTAANVAPDQYLGLSCAALNTEKTKLAARQTALGPTLIPVEDEAKREQELSQVSGEMKAIDQATAQNNCATKVAPSGKQKPKKR